MPLWIPVETHDPSLCDTPDDIYAIHDIHIYVWHYQGNLRGKSGCFFTHVYAMERLPAYWQSHMEVVFVPLDFAQYVHIIVTA